MIPPQSMPGEGTYQLMAPEGELDQSMPQEGEPNQSMAQKRTTPKPNPESMHIKGEFRLAMTQETIHAHGVGLSNLDRRLSLYPIAELSELMPYCLWPREGQWITDHASPII